MGYVIKGSCEPPVGLKKKVIVCLILGVLFITIGVLTIIFNPILIMTAYKARIDYGTATSEALTHEMDSIHISAYLFNITNAEQFISGEDEKLKVEEVGPFTYQENRTNEDFEIDHEAEVMRYTPRNRVTFLPDESVGNPEEMVVIMPNLAMLSMASLVSDYGYIAKMGFNLLTAQLGSNATVTMSVHDYLWGYDEPLIRMGNTILPGWISFNRLGLLDRLYDKNTTMRMEVSTKKHEKFMIKTVNGLGGLKQWGYEDPKKRNECNSFTNSYEGLGYPAYLPRTQPIRLYRPILCRSLDLEYSGTNTYQGVEGSYYKISNRSFTNIPENQCLCSKGTCHESISDLSPCLYGLPLVLSNAHFLGADPSIYNRVEGMTPNEEDHGSGFTIEQRIGMVMTTKFSVQVNVNVKDVAFSSKIRRFSNMFVPVVHVKIVQPKMGDDAISMLQMIHNYLPYVLLAVQTILFVAGLWLLSHAARLMYWNWMYGRREVALHLQTKDVKDIQEPLMRT